nr:hypothetical protein [Tanacetum cinerariifolium]
MMDDLLNTRIGYATKTTHESYTKEFGKKAQEERKLYIDVVKKSSTINESLDNFFLANSSFESKSTYEVSTSLTEFELKKILLNKIERSKSYQAALEHRELYDGLVKSYNLDKDLFSSYENVYSLKRNHDDKDKDEDPSAGLDRGLKKQKTSKDAEPPKGSKIKESTSSPSKGTKSQPKSFGKSVQTEELMFETVDTEMPQDQEGDIEDQPNVEATLIDDWFKKPNKPMTPDLDWNDGKSIDFRQPQKWISNISKARQPPRMFDEIISTPIDFLAYVMHKLKIDNLTQEILCYKAITDELDWNNPEGQEYPFDLSKPNRRHGSNVIESSKGNKESKRDVFSRKRVIAVTHVKVMKWYDYGYLEEIIVQRED